LFTNWIKLVNDITLPGTQAVVHKTAALRVTGEYKDDENQLNAIPTEVVPVDEPKITYNENTENTTIKFKDAIPQGSFVLLRTFVTAIEYGLDQFVRSGADEALEKVDLLDLNVIMYRCEAEERDESDGKDGVYVVPNYGPLTYAGLHGWVHPVREMVARNDTAHPIADNLRAGNWAMDFTISRLFKYLKNYPNLKPFIAWLESRFNRIRTIPQVLVPRYFALVIFTAYTACYRRVMNLMPGSLKRSTMFLNNLALVSVQMVGKVPSASVFPFETLGSMAAGLPHFSSGYMRCWGRDVFLSFKGLLLSTGRFEDAKNHILGFAATLKHGLIPNLLDSGRYPRYNARDATWFFLQSIQDYCKAVPDGTDILDEKIKRRFPLDDTFVELDDPRAFSEESTIREIIYEIFARHAKGIQFREANAGPDIDQQMKDEGFNQNIYVDWKNGIIFGGNEWNCGTWMDKMGESEKAGNKGHPGTPRDGAAIEITGLLKSALRWVNNLRVEEKFPWNTVTNQNGDEVSFMEWERKLQRSFEKAYYIPRDPKKDILFEVDSKIVHRRGIYKDLYRSSKPYEDYQLRPNFAIAMTVAPELFDVDRAMGALAAADTIILGPVGMRTLDPEDYNYRPYYENSIDNDDFATSKGRNYHQGPEWVWLRGYYLRAMLQFDVLRKKRYGGDRKETFQQLHLRMIELSRWIRQSPWGGLTELTNKDGAICNDSSPTQAWSAATIIDLFEDSKHYLEYSKAHRKPSY
jgi:glycogen debranching enzyme